VAGKDKFFLLARYSPVYLLPKPLIGRNQTAVRFIAGFDDFG